MHTMKLFVVVEKSYNQVLGDSEVGTMEIKKDGSSVSLDKNINGARSIRLRCVL